MSGCSRPGSAGAGAWTLRTNGREIHPLGAKPATLTTLHVAQAGSCPYLTRVQLEGPALLPYLLGDLPPAHFTPHHAVLLGQLTLLLLTLGIQGKRRDT